MIEVLLLSDTHGWLDPALEEYISAKDEVWHAGDIGSMDVLATIRSEARKVRAVFGNIDSAVLRRETEEVLIWQAEGLKMLMMHIGGYPPRYNKNSIQLIDRHQPDLFICGHSHILKIMPDKERKILHINPGAAGFIGFHKKRTAVQFRLDQGKIKDVEVIELGERGTTNTDN